MLLSFGVKVLRKVLQRMVLAALFFQMMAGSVLAEPTMSPPNSASGARIDMRAPQIEKTQTSQPAPLDKVTDMRKVTPQNQKEQTPTVFTRQAKGDRPQDPYEDFYDSIEKFNQEVYGDNG